LQAAGAAPIIEAWLAGGAQLRLSPSPKIPREGRADGATEVGPESFRGRRPQRADRRVGGDRRGREQIAQVLARTRQSLQLCIQK
jgi:hypothetical protein